MKTIRIITLLIFSLPIAMNGQEWLELGNSGTNETINFVGTLNTEDLRFRTDNQFRMGIDGISGFLGLHTTNPTSLFHMNAASSGNGLLFRADGDQSVSNFWQLYTGASAAAQTKRFEIEVLPGSYNVNINNNDGGVGTGEAEIQLRTAEIKLQARGKRLGDFCETSTGADEVIMGDGSRLYI